MPNEMIERVARALARDGLSPEGVIAFNHDSQYYINSFSLGERNMYERKAKIAIEALREPTKEMKLNGGKAYRDCGGLGPCPSHSIFNAMIDTALKE